MKYDVLYKDKVGTIKGVIENKFSEDFNNIEDYTLELQLGEVIFKGDTFDGLRLFNGNDLDEEKLARFSYDQSKDYITERIIKELSNCKIAFNLGVEVVDKETINSTLINGYLEINLGTYSHKEYSLFQYSFTINNTNLIVVGDSFEEVFEKLKKTIKETHLIMNCYGCNYSDYSPYGRDSFGDMLCFKRAKLEYLQVKDKVGLFESMTKIGAFYTQETYLCKEFEFRKENTGYRG